MRLILLLLSTLLIIGCTTGHQEDTSFTVIDVDLDNPDRDTLYYSEIVDSVTYIELESSDEAMIGRIADLDYNGNEIVVLDDKTGLVKLFGKDGHFISQIGARGQGPEEYTRAKNVDVKDSVIAVFDIALNKVLLYETNGKFCGADSIGTAEDFVQIGFSRSLSYLIADYSTLPKKKGGIRLVSHDGGERMLRERKDVINNNHLWEIFKNSGEMSVITQDYEYTILKVDGDSLSVMYQLNVAPLPSESSKKKIAEHDVNELISNYSRLFHVSSNRWLIIYFWKKDNPRVVLIDKVNGKANVCSGIVNDLDTEEVIGRAPVLIDGAMVEYVDGPDEDSNPRLKLYHLKK